MLAMALLISLPITLSGGIEYPKTCPYGINILNLSTDTFRESEEFCLAADLPKKASLSVKISGGGVIMSVAPNNPVNFSYNRQTDTFTVNHGGQSAYMHIMLSTQENHVLEYYENGSVSPTRTREITFIP